MKKLLLIFAFFLIPSSASTMMPSESFWFCSQVGTLNGEVTLVHSPVHKNLHSWTFKEKAEAFEKDVKRITDKQFEGAYNAFCIDYPDPKPASSHLLKVIEKAKKLGFNILQISLDLKEKKE